MAKPKVYRVAGYLFHEDCLPDDDPQQAAVVVSLDELDDDDECEECSGIFLSGLEPDDVDDADLETEDGDDDDD